MTFEDYIAREHEAEMRRMGYIEYAAVELHHICGGLCGGDNPDCRRTTKREWRKPRSQGGE